MAQKTVQKEIQSHFGINHILAHKVAKHADPNRLLESSQQFLDNKPKPFVKWVGGKRQLLAQFRELGLYPPEHFNPSKNKYFEPFVGGGAVFFDLLPEHALLSDLNNELVTTYNVIKNDVEALIKSLKKQEVNLEVFLKMRAKDVAKLSDLQIATRFIFLNKTCFNGMFRVNSMGQFNVPFAYPKNPLICDAENLRDVSRVLQDVVVRHQDYKKAVKHAKKGDFIYFDPPYHPMSDTSSFTSYTKEAFGEKEQLELRDTFIELHKRGCFVMLSNSNAPFINKIYSEIKDKKVRITHVAASRAINSVGSGRGKIKEVLITNYQFD